MRKSWVAVAIMAIVASGLLIVGMNRAAAEGEGDMAKDLLFVCQDEKSLEIGIQDYLKRKHDVTGVLQASGRNPEDMFLRYTLSPPGGVPEVQVTIDTLASARKDERVTERAIRFVAFYILPAEAKTPEARKKIHELNNKWMLEKWMPGRIYIDNDGDIALESFVNIPGPEIPVHAEMAYDMLARTLNAWKGYYPELTKIVPVRKQVTTAPATTQPAPSDQ